MPDEILKNVMAVVKWLQNEGYDIKKSTVYKHRSEGKLIADKTGRYPVSSVKRYARNWIIPLPGSTPPANVIDLQEKKLIAEARKIEAQAEHWELKTKIVAGEYVERDAFGRELAARAMVFRSDMENFIRSHGVDIITTVKGDPLRLPDLISLYLDQLENWLSRYSEPDSLFGDEEEA
jgi:hypothetical protein